MEPSSTTFAGPITLLKSAWSLFKPNWKILVPIAITPSLAIIVGQLLAMLGGAFMVIGILVSIAGFVFAIAMAPALITALPKIESGGASTIKYWSQYRVGFGFFSVVLGLAILQSLILIGSGVLLIIPGIMVGTYLGVYIFARILDGHKGFAAFTESFSLVRGRWWKVLGRVFAFVLFYIILAIMAALIEAIFGGHSAVTAIIAIIINLILTAVMGPMALVYIYKMYNALKSTRLQNVPTATFKKWLIVFLVIGIIAIILIPITGVWVVFSPR